MTQVVHIESRVDVGQVVLRVDVHHPIGGHQSGGATEQAKQEPVACNLAQLVRPAAQCCPSHGAPDESVRHGILPAA